MSSAAWRDSSSSCDTSRLAMSLALATKMLLPSIVAAVR
eukprot:CAMPEP_0114159362 /NCGR_PEP_ID=MMETSP0043_2-20121206/27739_1 /TAXON_ID=464988 /ORGANISM="Hemiselmis andersenii, Strain CCMP644" /LENGTH=38 /DNA_ID= /DNA_START= /DNA_END= /DNA_ORIENTATION=